MCGSRSLRLLNRVLRKASKAEAQVSNGCRRKAKRSQGSRVEESPVNGILAESAEQGLSDYRKAVTKIDGRECMFAFSGTQRLKQFIVESEIDASSFVGPSRTRRACWRYVPSSPPKASYLTPPYRGHPYQR